MKEIIIQPLTRELHKLFVKTQSDTVNVKSRAFDPKGADGNAKRFVRRDEERKTVAQEDSELPLTSVS